MSTRLRAVVVAFTSIMLLAACASRSPAPSPPQALTPQQRELELQSFDQVWETIRDRHFDPTYNGTDWNAVRAEFRPKVEAAQTVEESRAAIGGAIERLRQSHFGIIGREAYEDLTPGAAEASATDIAGPGSTGIQPRPYQGKALVFRVEPGSPADAAGVKPGWLIERVEGRPMAPTIKQVGAAFEGQVKRHAMISRALLARLSGDIGKTIKVDFLDPRGKRRSASLTLAPPRGKPVKVMALPEMYLTQEAMRLPSGVGYITFSIFMDPALVPWFAQNIREFGASNAPGVIVDLRGNPGGVGAMAMGMGNWFVIDSTKRLGTMNTRATEIKFVLNPQAPPFKAPVAVLVDEESMSTSEILAGGLQAIGRARVFGSPTPGMALPSAVVRLPNGDGFQYAQANYTSASGTVLEGHGVVPDEPVALDPVNLEQGRDPVIEAAERWILAQRAR